MAKNDVTVKVIADAKGFQTGMATAESALGRFTHNVTSIAGPAIAAGIVAAGVGLVALGDKFDGAYDRIQIATGATGDKLKGLQGSFDTILASGPSSFDDVASAVSGLNQRLGLTGKPLEDLSTQMLDLSRITGTDVSTNIENLSQVMNKWNIPAADMGTSMDELFRASQVTGIGIDDLGSQMTRFGAPLQELGFSFDEAAALLGGFEQNGINTTAAMTGMRRALGNLRQPGETGRQTLARLTTQIQNAGTDADATALAIQLFGQKAGPEMAAAIRDGKFDLDAYMGTIEDGQSTIENTAASTDDWREKWNTLKNQVFVKLKPLAIKFFDAITVGMGWIIKHQGVLVGALIAVGVVVTALFAAWVVSAVAAAAATLVAAAPFIAIGLAVAALAAGFIWLYENVQIFHNVVDSVGRFIRDNWMKLLIDLGTLIIGGPIVAGLVALYNHWKWFHDAVDPILKAVVKAAGVVVDWFKANWPKIAAYAAAVVNYFTKTVWPLLQGIFKAVVRAATAVVDFFRDHWSDISSIVRGIIKWFKDLPGKVGDVLKTLKQKGADLATGLWQGFSSTIVSTTTYLAHLAANAVIWVGDVASTLLQKGKDLALGLYHGFFGLGKDAVGSIVSIGDWLSNLKSNAVTWVGSVGKTLFSAGSALATGLWNGLVSGFHAVTSWAAGIPAKIYHAIPNPWTALSGLGHALASGLSSAFNSVLNGLITIYNNTVGRLPGVDNIPSVGGGGTTKSGGKISRAQGGWIPGRGPVPIIAHGGEYVMSRAELAGNLRGDSPLRGGGGSTTVINNFPAGVTARDTAAATRRYTRLQAA